MRFRQRFTVEGRGKFPLDMLRYDHCWPADQDSVQSIHFSLERTQKRADGPRAIVLLRDVFDKGAEPQVERWLSFSWRVTSVLSAKATP